MEVFMSAVRWLKHDWENRDQYKYEVLYCVRFGNIAPWQLVDIKRNPENPDFMELAKDNVICKLIDDGLAFVIIKYWYGQENDDFQHWNGVLGLQEPPARNWSGSDKTYFTYREFLIYLDQYRRNQLMEKNKPKMMTDRKPTDAKGSPGVAPAKDTSYEKMPAPAPTMDEFLKKKPLPSETTPSTTEMPRRYSLRDSPETITSTGEIPRHSSLSPVPETTTGTDGIPRHSSLRQVPETAASTDEIPRHMSQLPPYESTTTPAKIPRRSSMRPPHETTTPTTGEPSTAEIPKRFSVSRTQKLGMTDHEAAIVIQNAWKQHLKRKPLIPNSSEDIVPSPSVPEDIRLLFTPEKNDLFKQNMNRLSRSALGPESKLYVSENSLFYSQRESILIFGGLDPHTSFGLSRNNGKEIMRYVPHQNQWELVGELPEPRQHHCVAFMKGRVYLVGGADPRDDDVRGKSIVVDTVWSFEPVKRSWFSEGSLNIPRKNFGLVSHKNHLFAIGGQDRQCKTLASVERFDSKRGSWSLMAPMQYTRTGLACAKYRGVVWAAGGLSILPRGNKILDVVESYNIDANQWTEITNMRFPRCFFTMFVTYDRLYLVGGAGFETKKDPITVSLSSIETWDVKNMKWTQSAEMVIPRHGHTIAFIGTQFLIIGGVTTIYMRALSNAECFCVQRGRWVRGVAPLPLPVSGHASVTLPPAMLISR